MDTETKKLIEENKIIAIIRKVYGNDLIQLAHALYSGGINLLEITFDQVDPDCIQKATDSLALIANNVSEMVLGAGTVLDKAQVDAAVASGARYIVSPNTDEEVISRSKQMGVVSIPGAMTPTEMVNAIHCGADYVKVFPVSDLGLKYMKDVMSPLDHIKFIATGGINLENFSDYLDIGFVAAGIGGHLTDKKLIEKGDFSEFTNRARGFVEIARRFAND